MFQLVSGERHHKMITGGDWRRGIDRHGIGQRPGQVILGVPTRAFERHVSPIRRVWDNDTNLKRKRGMTLEDAEFFGARAPDFGVTYVWRPRSLAYASGWYGG